MIRSASVALFAALCLGMPAVGQSPEARGKAIYFGEDPSALDTTLATISSTGTSLPATVFPCANCHGEFGAGKPERGILPPNLSRTALTKPYDVFGERGRQRGPYTLETFGRALREGTDPAGNDLDVAMPRYAFSDQAIADVWHFLATVQDPQDPGISDKTLRLAFLQTGDTASRPVLRSGVMAVVDGLVEDINLQGGIHGRQLDIVHVTRPDDPAIDTAFLVMSLGRPERPPADDILLLQTQGPTGLGRRAYSLYSGREEQAAALRAYAARELTLVKLSDWSCDGAPVQTAYLVVTPDCLDDLPPDLPAFLTQSAFEALSAAQRRRLPGETYVALPSGADQIPQPSQYAFVRFMRSKQIAPGQAVMLQAQAYSLMSVAIEGLMQSGRTLSRTVFTEQIEAFDRFMGAVGPPLSFGRNRRVGNAGARIVAFSAQSQTFSPDATWIELDRPGGR